jgi:4'-phosphopantetheinyl transferase
VFSVSHTRGLVACAVTRAAHVGVDVERIDRARDTQGVAERHFTSAEVDMLRRCGDKDRAARFVELWTLKEAFLKSEGQGLGSGLDTCGFAFSGTSNLCLSPARSGWSFFLATWPAAGRLAVACRARTGVSLQLTIHSRQPQRVPGVEPRRWTDGLTWQFESDALRDFCPTD